MASVVEPLLPEGIDLEFVLEEEVGEIIAEPTQMEQILMNLILNARDAIDSEGRILLTCSRVSLARTQAAKLEVEAGDFVKMSVSDTGSGMDAETRSRIFEPFFSTKTRERGYGLGLAVVESIVQLHGGWIEVETQVEKGSTFSVYLPEKRYSSEGPQTSSLPLRETTVMVVDDDADLLAMLNLALTRAGYSVIAASNGREALERLEAGDSPDLLLTDVAMPELDGVGLASELSRMKLQLPIIFMSSSAPKELSDRFASERLDWPSEAFVSKPFQLVHIVDAIEGALNALPDTQEHLPLF